MKLYHMNPNTWGQEWYVCAKDQEEAFDSIMGFIKDENEKRLKDWGYETSAYVDFKDSTLQNLPDKYTLDEYKPGEVKDSEIA